MAVRLSNATVSALPPDVARPGYDRSRLRPGVLHIGVGNFHRAHQAVYLDDLFRLGQAEEWALLGAGVMPGDQVMYDALQAQDWLYALVDRDANHVSARVIGSISGMVPVTDDHAALSHALLNPDIRIVSLTVTEGGYFVSSKTGSFDPNHAAIQADARFPETPQTVFGLIVRALRHRRDNGLPPFTVMSCDNVPHNGDVTRAAVTGVAALIDTGLADWIENEVTFPNCMVDRITPATSVRERTFLRETYGVEDAWPVFCEPFRQWVLEDNFTRGRPPFDKVGVEFVPDVTPYETMKLRILNGGHAVMAYPAGLLDIEFADEAMSHPLIAGFFEKVEREEIIPVVPPVPNTSLDDYYSLIEARFANPTIGDTIRRLCNDGANRQPKFIVPSIIDNLNAGNAPMGLALESAFWCRYCYGSNENGAEIEPNDPNWDRLQDVAKSARSEPVAWLEMRDIYGDLADNDGFRNLFGNALHALWDRGTAEVLRDYLGLGEPI